MPATGASFSRSYGGNLPSSFSTVTSSASVCSTSPPVSVSGTVHMVGLFPGTASPPDQSDKVERHLRSVTSTGPRTIDLVPIGYGFRPRLRGRLTLRGIALRRNPWTFGVRVSRSHFATRVSIRTSDTSSSPPGPPSQAYGTLRYRRAFARPAASVRGLSPVTSSAQDGLIRPVSCYAFFKGWLLLSQPPGCFGLPTSFPT